ncbi:hypothetical protein [Bacillus sp. UNCCL81]|uniref:hypothetical protein n=1 Tax=Bacillus sp. UNCCL81 TaxID=1502755 RepID=UPI0008E56A16|nr:hypothetical protein [Bacillus sp. UNCCL81]SFD43959.1 hypothetical protein SAMN02799633_03818 [Bacillus sp. UNCCL81]
MITASNLFNGNMMAKSRVVDSYIVVNGTTTYDSSKIVNWEFHDTVSLSDVFEIGTAISNTFTVVLQNITPNISLDNTVIEPFIGVNVGGSTYEYISLGKFIIDGIDYDSVVKRYTITSSDFMRKLDIEYTWVAGTTDTIANVMSRISTLSGVSLTGTYPTTTIKKVTGFTCREMLGFMAGLMAGWGVINRTGSIAVKVPRSTDPNINPIYVGPGGSGGPITFDTNISNYVKGNSYTMTVSSASRATWDTLGVKIGDYITNGGTLGGGGIWRGLGTITQINGYTVTIRCEQDVTDSSPATFQDFIARRTVADIVVTDDNFFDFQSVSDTYIIEQITGTDFNGNKFTNGTRVNNMELRVKNPFITQAYVDSIAAVLLNRVFAPYVMDWQGNPVVEAGDNLRIDRLNTGDYPWTVVVTDTVWQYPDFSAISQQISEGRAVNFAPDDDTGDTINGGDIINSNIYGGLLVKTNSGGSGGPSFGNGYFGIHMKNQDMLGCNTFAFSDTSDSQGEGFLWLKSTGASESTDVNDYYNMRMDGSGNLRIDNNIIFATTPTFTNLTLQNGATINNSRTPKFTKLNGIVYLEGEISAGLANGTIVATLPVGYRPAAYSLNILGGHASSATTASCLWSINLAGQITLIVSNGTHGVCLNNIQFVAEQ